MKTIEITCPGEIPEKKAILHLTYDEFLEEIKNLTEEEADRFFDVCQEVADRRNRRSLALVRSSDMLYEITTCLATVVSQLSLLPYTTEREDAEYPLNDEERAYAYHDCINTLDNLKNGLKAILACERAYVNGDDEALKVFLKMAYDEDEDDDPEEDLEDEADITGEDLDLFAADEDDDPDDPDPLAA